MRHHNQYGYQIENIGYSDIIVCIHVYSSKIFLYVKFEVPMIDGTVAINVLKENNKYGYQIEDIHHNVCACEWHVDMYLCKI